MGESDVLVVAWITRNARTDDLGYWLGAEVRFMPWAWPGLPAPRRVLSWLRSARATLRAVRGHRQGSIIVIEPPIFAPLTAWAARRPGCRLFLDLHSGALIAPNWRWARPLLGFVARRCDGVIVTNLETLEGFDLGATPAYVLHDPLWARPAVAPGRAGGAASEAGGGASGGVRYVLFPASASPDEPLDLVEQVGRILKGDPIIKVTGRVGRPSTTGVEYVGFLAQSDFDALLAHATAVLSLTEWEATMQRSAYEAVHAGVPVVALDRRVLRQVFDGAGAVFARDDPADIARAVRDAVDRRAQLAAETAVARSRLADGSEIVKQVLLG